MMASAMLSTMTSDYHHTESEYHEESEQPNTSTSYSSDQNGAVSMENSAHADEQLNGELSSPGPLMISVSPDLSLSPSKEFGEEFSEDFIGAPSPGSKYNGDSLSPQHPVNYPITPVWENGQEVYYCHLCSFSSTSRLGFNCHLDGHFEHKCNQCDYTSRTEGRLKQHLNRFHNLSTADSARTDDYISPGDRSALLPTTPSDNVKAEQSSRTATSANGKTPGRQKVYRCKQCDFVATVKADFWQHARVHIKEEKILTCPKCPFVTEYKHHLEYHLRNHFGSKPFKCTKCNYACVNKSMLNSHMKSHTNIYQYRCADCTYATKYCHSLKLHLRKYCHKPASIINLDGTVDHDISALLVSKRSAPRNGKKGNGAKEEELVQSPNPMIRPNLTSTHGFHPQGHMMPFWQLPNMRAPPPPMLPANFNFFRGLLPPPMLSVPQPLERGSPLQRTVTKPHEHYYRPVDMSTSSSTSTSAVTSMTGYNMNQFCPMPILPSSDVSDLSKKPTPETHVTDSSNTSNSTCEGPLDLSKTIKEQTREFTETAEQTTSSRRRSRKGKAYKLEALCLKLQDQKTADDEADDIVTIQPAPPMESSSPEDFQDNFSQDSSASENVSTYPSSTSMITRTDEVAEQNNNDQSTDKCTSKAADLMKKAFAAQNGLMSVEEHMQRAVNTHDQGRDRYSCPYCEISFTNCIMYTVHMGYHGYQDPYKCNMCGEESKDKVSFFLHIARAAHA